MQAPHNFYTSLQLTKLQENGFKVDVDKGRQGFIFANLFNGQERIGREVD
jgi:hypothetical protein